jgi:hypothetical protein
MIREEGSLRKMRTSVNLICCTSLLVASHAAAQSPVVASKDRQDTKRSYTPPKTLWGDPDLQGLWPNTNDIPFERDPALGTRAYLTDKEWEERQKKALQRQERDSAYNDSEKDSPRYWREYGLPTKQSSMIIDPPDGRLPPLTPEAIERRKHEKLLGDAGSDRSFDSYEDFNIYNRCITRGIFGSITSTIYNNGNQILQAPGYVVIRNEMIHENRVISLERRPHVGENIRLYMGDSLGHWEGNTLVIETTNLTDKDPVEQEGIAIAGSHTKQLRLIERLTRTAPDQLRYELTVDDPATWTRPWTIRIPLKSDPTYQLYEYACHEANYGLKNILEGDRAAEKQNKQ